MDERIAALEARIVALEARIAQLESAGGRLPIIPPQPDEVRPSVPWFPPVPLVAPGTREVITHTSNEG